MGSLPSDLREQDRAEVERALVGVLRGEDDSLERVEKLLQGKPLLTRRLLSTVLRFVKREYGKAEEEISRLLEAEPEIDPAYALRGQVRIRLRRLEDARSDLTEARLRSPDLPLPYRGLVYLAIYEGDLERALGTLEENPSALTPLTTLLRLDHETFMKKPGIHYAQAWAVVHYLKNVKDKALSSLLRRYLTVLREGQSRERPTRRSSRPWWTGSSSATGRTTEGSGSTEHGEHGVLSFPRYRDACPRHPPEPIDRSTGTQRPAGRLRRGDAGESVPRVACPGKPTTHPDRTCGRTTMR